MVPPSPPIAAEIWLIVACTWIAAVAPVNTPAPIVSKLNRTFNDIMTSADTKTHFTRLGWEPVVSTPQGLGDYIKSEVVRWGKVLQAAGAVGIE